MEIKGKHVYAHGVDTMFKSFGDPHRIEARFRALGARDIQIDHCKLTKTTLDISMRRDMPVEAPGILKKFLGTWNQSTQTERWVGNTAKGYTCDLTIVLKGVPVTVTGRYFLSGDAHQCANDVILTFESGIPLVGAKLAEFVGTQAKLVMQREYEFICQSF
jgi:hypothetical protein